MLQRTRHLCLRHTRIDMLNLYRTIIRPCILNKLCVYATGCWSYYCLWPTLTCICDIFKKLCFYKITLRINKTFPNMLCAFRKRRMSVGLYAPSNKIGNIVVVFMLSAPLSMRSQTFKSASNMYNYISISYFVCWFRN